VLEQNGVDVLMTRVPATSSIKERAQMLEEAISEKYGGRQVNLVGHSMVRQLSQHNMANTDSHRVVLIVDISSLNSVRKLSSPSLSRQSLPLIAVLHLQTT
jgi:hypothetical protein